YVSDRALHAPSVATHHTSCPMSRRTTSQKDSLRAATAGAARTMIQLKPSRATLDGTRSAGACKRRPGNSAVAYARPQTRRRLAHTAMRARKGDIAGLPAPPSAVGY